MKPTIAYIGIGSNLGDKSFNCQYSIDQIDTLPGCHVIARSTLFKTEPVGVTKQPWYVNCIAQIRVTKSPFALLQGLMNIESVMGRVRRKRWEARIIDLDILLFGQEIRESHNLLIPHPLMHKRRFVLQPLAQLAPDLVHPVFKVTIQELLNKLPIPLYSGTVEILKEET
ncbi:MAG: 2-amino-4-hydroxy-6-hydroxymethyldihydropteridine diphosphokinase [Deltaproteobacteria bacterium]|nr:2-amino-4-hydroxy-6-hydroxymethyldihydropteridine diphosphokinase [Deltaproteobacteria bacterium]MBW2334206.1 2-amino-4-hydroxy-6-hydroxymethyldihydropteridine diphosphokinase [Deltaproteobacteria bacterium]